MSQYCPKCGQGYDDDDVTCSDDGETLRQIGDGEDRRLGQLIHDRFRLVDVLGSGGAGVVYRAIQRPIGREVAVKILSETNRDKNGSEYERFFREAQLASSLRHPNIVSPVDFGEDSEYGVVYFAMEYVEGIDLHDLLNGNRVTVPLALEILYQTCGALTDAHDKGIIHRDLKPGNVRLTVVSDGSLQVKILDLGIARPIETQQDITRTGNITGTMSYIPPEYVLEGDLGGHSDLYSMGIVFFEMLTGQKPFSGNHLQILFHHVSTPAPKISDRLPEEAELPAELADDIEDFFQSLAEKKPAQRFENAREVRTKIDELRLEHNIEEVTVENHSGPATVETFESWLADAEEVNDDPQSMPSDVIANLMEAGAEMVTDGSGGGKARVHLPTPPPLPADKVNAEVAKRTADADLDEVDVEELDEVELDELDEVDVEELDEVELDELDEVDVDELDEVDVDELDEVDVEEFDETEAEFFDDPPLAFEEQQTGFQRHYATAAAIGICAVVLVGLGTLLALGDNSEEELNSPVANSAPSEDDALGNSADKSTAEERSREDDAEAAPAEPDRFADGSPPDADEMEVAPDELDDEEPDEVADEEDLSEAFREASVGGEREDDEESAAEETSQPRRPSPATASQEADEEEEEEETDEFQQLLDRAGTL